jgi:hypothetical protein
MEKAYPIQSSDPAGHINFTPQGTIVTSLSSRRAKSPELKNRFCLDPYRKRHQIDLSDALISSMIAYLSLEPRIKK